MVLASIVFAASVAAAASNEVTNSQWGFRTTYPASWVVQQGTAGPIYVSAAPPAPETLVRCNTTAEKSDETRTYTQSKLNEGLGQSMGADFWSKQVFGRFQNVQIESHASRRHPSGIQVQQAVASYDDQVQGETVRGRTSSTIFVTPGATFSISCNAQAGKYAKYKNDFAKLVDSFRLSDTNTVDAGATASPVAFSSTLKTEAAAGGVSFVAERTH
jgi:hypothetical protein